MDRLWIILIGGLVPAFLFGVSAIFQKSAVLGGVTAGTYIVIDGLVMVAVGLILRQALGETTFLAPGWPWAVGGGLCFAVAASAFAFAVQRMGAPVSLLAPITVISTLVTVVLSFIIFREHIGVKAVQLMGGALLVVGGAALVATS
jgi:uncharacterized membrane protein